MIVAAAFLFYFLLLLFLLFFLSFVFLFTRNKHRRTGCFAQIEFERRCDDVHVGCGTQQRKSAIAKKRKKRHNSRSLVEMNGWR